MGSSFGITIPRPERPLADSLSDVPRGFREQAKKGFGVLAGIGKQHYAEILRAVIISLETRQAPLEELEKHLGISKNDLGSLFAASMITVPILGGGGGTAEEFLSAAVKIQMIPAEIVTDVKPFIETVVAERAQLNRAIRRAALPAQVLPFLSEVEIVVDLRLAFEAQTILEAVPVAIFHIDTDAEGWGREIWFQASRPQMERLRSDIDDAIKHMEAADVWGRRETAS